jgi:hypothetical protein
MTMLAALMLTAGPALAHPVDEVVQGAYLTLAPGEARLELDLTPGPLVSMTLITALDADGDKRITAGEARAYGAMVLGQSGLTLDGKAAAWRLDHVVVPAYEALAGETDTVKVYAVTARPETTGRHVLAYVNRYSPAKTRANANIFLQPGAGWRYQVDGQTHSDDGRGLTVRYSAAR